VAFIQILSRMRSTHACTFGNDPGANLGH
jgi:hypothetical protein